MFFFLKKRSKKVLIFVLLGDMYQRGQSGPGIAPSVTGPTGNMPPTGVTNSASKTGSDYSGYGTGYGKSLLSIDGAVYLPTYIQ